MKGFSKIRAKVFAGLLALVFALSLFSALPRTAYASEIPSAVSVTYYDGVYTRGWTWRTDQNVLSGEVQIIEKKGSVTKQNADWSNPDITQAALSSNLPGGATGDTTNNKIWKANYNFTSAADGKTYLYRVGSEQGWSPVGEQAIDGGADGVYLIHTTDPQGSDATDFGYWKQTVEKAYAAQPNAQTMICTGDFVEVGSNITQWNMMLNMPQATLIDAVITPVVGNHDTGIGWFNSHFNLAGSPSYYSYNIGNVHITVLYTVPSDTTTPFTIAAGQLNWLKSDLAAANADPAVQWKIVAMHVPVVSTGNHGVLAYLNSYRNQIFPVMAQYKVDLVLQGHDHVYARSNPFLWSNAAGNSAAASYTSRSDNFFGENRTYMSEPDGTTYVIINTAGYKGYSANTGNSLPEFLRPGTNALAANAQPNASMFGAITIRDSVLLYESYTVNRSTGAAALYDYAGVIKNESGLPAKTPFITVQPKAAADEGGAVNLTVAASSLDGGALSYQWYKNAADSNRGGSLINGAVSAGYTVAASEASSYPYYYVVVTNSAGGKTALKTSAVAAVIKKVAPATLTLTVPEEGQTPSTQITDGEGFTSVLAWMGTTAQITLTAQEGYSFAGYNDLASISGFKVNGRAPDYFYYLTEDGKSLRFLVSFGTEEENNNENKNPPGGCASVSFSGGGFTGLFTAAFAAVLMILINKKINKGETEK